MSIKLSWTKVDKGVLTMMKHYSSKQGVCTGHKAFLELTILFCVAITAVVLLSGCAGASQLSETQERLLSHPWENSNQQPLIDGENIFIENATSFTATGNNQIDLYKVEWIEFKEYPQAEIDRNPELKGRIFASVIYSSVVDSRSNRNLQPIAADVEITIENDTVHIEIVRSFWHNSLNRSVSEVLLVGDISFDGEIMRLVNSSYQTTFVIADARD